MTTQADKPQKTTRRVLDNTALAGGGGITNAVQQAVLQILTGVGTAYLVNVDPGTITQVAGGIAFFVAILLSPFMSKLSNYGKGD